MTTFPRRTLLSSLAAVAVGCGKRAQPGRSLEPSAEAVTTASGERGNTLATTHDLPVRSAASDAEAGTGVGGFALREMSFDQTPVGPERAVVLIPSPRTAEERFPVLVALHGRGEAVRGIEAGAYGWVRDYQIGRTLARLAEPPLTREDWQGFVEGDRFSQVNRALQELPYQGLIVVCPWLPDLMAAERDGKDLATPFARFLLEQLLPRVLEETPALSTPSSVGIDGVSLGGRAALLVGLAYPDRFGAIGTLQPAIQRAEATAWCRRALAARTRTPTLRLRLLTSDGDFFRQPVGALDAELVGAGVEHDFVLSRGPHDYVFNRGPGGIEMLLWHDRVLRGQMPV